MAQTPDHVLIVEAEPGMRRILEREISDTLRISVDAITPDDIREDHSKILGALVLTLPRWASLVATLLPRHHPFLLLRPSAIDKHVSRIQDLKDPSAIGIASVSQVLLETARALLAPFIGNFHTLEEHHIPETEIRDLTGLDLVFCDTLAYTTVTARPGRIEHYRLISDAAAQEISHQLASQN